uniref:KRAB-A domain-containing protein 2-like n=1 Tax=Diabrotica virgifera virgifera TaxID=50390 RepID=A0A6P7GQ22_DIAVI
MHGKPIHIQSQGSVANKGTENILSFWLESNQTNKLSEGLRSVQFDKNRAYLSGIKYSPYEAMFGVFAKVGFKTSSLPEDALENISTVEDLEVEEKVEETKSGPDSEEYNTTRT